MQHIETRLKGMESSEVSCNSFSARIYIKRKDEVEELKKIHKARLALEALGVQLSVGPGRCQDSRGFLACTLSIHIDREITSRGAGRRIADSGFTLEDIERMLAQGCSAQKIADKAGMSLATYYRHLKKSQIMKNKGYKAANIPF